MVGYMIDDHIIDVYIFIYILSFSQNQRSSIINFQFFNANAEFLQIMLNAT